MISNSDVMHPMNVNTERAYGTSDFTRLPEGASHRAGVDLLHMHEGSAKAFRN